MDYDSTTSPNHLRYGLSPPSSRNVSTRTARLCVCKRWPGNRLTVVRVPWTAAAQAAESAGAAPAPKTAPDSGAGLRLLVWPHEGQARLSGRGRADGVSWEGQLECGQLLLVSPLARLHSTSRPLTQKKAHGASEHSAKRSIHQNRLP